MRTRTQVLIDDDATGW